MSNTEEAKRALTTISDRHGEGVQREVTGSHRESVPDRNAIATHEASQDQATLQGDQFRSTVLIWNRRLRQAEEESVVGTDCRCTA